MQVRKYEAPTIQEALENVKRELGPEAIILQTKNLKKGLGLMSRPSVEITVAVSDRSLAKKTVTERKVPKETAARIAELPAARQASVYERAMERVTQRKNSSAQTEMSAKAGSSPGVRNEELTRKKFIEIDEPPVAQVSAPVNRSGAAAIAASLLQAQGQAQGQLQTRLAVVERAISDSGAQLRSASEDSDALRTVQEQLLLNGVEKRLVQTLIEEVKFGLSAQDLRDPERVLDELAGRMVDHVSVSPLFAGLKDRPAGTQPLTLALIGPTGVGKTTTIAKLASEVILKHRKRVGLINLDQFKVAAFDQLSTYAKLLNAPFRSVQDADGLAAALRDFSSLDVILIDTAGRSQKDLEALYGMADLLEGFEHVRKQLVLSSTTREIELLDTGRKFAMFRPDGLIFSKLDEAMSFGSLVNLPDRLKLPLTAFTTGQRVPEDFEDATAERVVSLILEL